MRIRSTLISVVVILLLIALTGRFLWKMARISPQARPVEVTRGSPSPQSSPSRGEEVLKRTPLPSGGEGTGEGKPPTLPKAPPAKPVVLHKELIPKDVTIVRFYYQEDLVVPGVSFEFDINGSGFTADFQKMIRVDSTDPEISVGPLTLVTPNQIHGSFAVSLKASSKFVYPQVLIQGKPVFQAPDPFGVVRPREVLQLFFTHVGEEGRSGRFRILTNLTQEEFPSLRVESSTSGIILSSLEPMLPFVVDGSLGVEPGVGTGSYDVRILLGDKTILQREKVINVIQPNVGLSGIILNASVEDTFRRPGDGVKAMVEGSGFHPEDAAGLSARVEGLAIQNSSFSYASAGRIRLSFTLPGDAPVGDYPIAIRQGETTVYQKGNAFRVVGPNWLRRVVLDPPLAAGKSGTLQIQGLGLTEGFAQALTIETDESGLAFGKVKWRESSLLEVPLQISPSVAPGDYLLTLRSGGQPVKVQFGSVIRISAP